MFLATFGIEEVPNVRIALIFDTFPTLPMIYQRMHEMGSPVLIRNLKIRNA